MTLSSRPFPASFADVATRVKVVTSYTEMSPSTLAVRILLPSSLNQVLQMGALPHTGLACGGGAGAGVWDPREGEERTEGRIVVQCNAM